MKETYSQKQFVTSVAQDCSVDEAAVSCASPVVIIVADEDCYLLRGGYASPCRSLEGSFSFVCVRLRSRRRACRKRTAVRERSRRRVEVAPLLGQACLTCFILTPNGIDTLCPAVCPFSDLSDDLMGTLSCTLDQQALGRGLPPSATGSLPRPRTTVQYTPSASARRG
jgi:hypothetical protein